MLLCSLCGRIVGNSSVLRQDGFGGCGYLSGILHRAVSRGPCRCVSGAGVRYEVLGLPRDSSLLWQVRVVPKHGPESQMRGFTAMRSSSDSA